jgi:hypothetical protein
MEGAQKVKATGTGTTRSFKAKVDENIIVELPFDGKEVFGQARAPITITLGGKSGADNYSFRSTIMVYGGKSYIGVRKSHREAAGLEPGDTTTITIAPDTAPREVDPPEDLALALKKNKTAKAGWDALSFTHKREHAEALLDAKKPETRKSRLDKTLKMLEETAAKKKAPKAKKASSTKKKPSKKPAAAKKKK